MSGQDAIYAMVTEKIITALETGTVPWRKPWGSSLPVSMNGNRPYRGINPFLLAITADLNGYTSRYWGTFNHIRSLGGQVRKGERSSIVVFWKRIIVKDDKSPDGKKVLPLLRFFRVFNADQADNLPAKFYASDSDNLPVSETAETVIKGYLAAKGPSLTHTLGDGAYYLPRLDAITLPPRDTFASADDYYSTAFHECAHSTGHATRLNRPGITAFDHFGSDQYGKEELCAEMTAAMLQAVTGTESVTDNSAAYVASWLRTIKGDPKLVIQAAAQAQRATDMILGIEYTPNPADES